MFFTIEGVRSQHTITNRGSITIEDFVGYWSSESEVGETGSSLRLSLYIDDENLTGLHWAQIRGGNQVDYPDKAEPYIHSYLKNDTVYLNFTNTWDDDVEAKIYFDQSDQYRLDMIWELIRYEPELVSFFPEKDTLRNLFKPQIIVPNEAIPENKIKKSQNTVSEIEEIALRIDTLYYYPKEENVTELLEFMYYDDESRIRKYYWNSQTHDASYEGKSYEAYYDKSGKLVYINYSSGSNCENAREEFWVCDERIVNFKADLYCDCCEDTNAILSEEEVDQRRPKIGDRLVRTITWEDPLAGFLTTESLLQLLNSDDRHGAYLSKTERNER